MPDTDVAKSKLTMPALEDLAVQTIQRLAADGYTSAVMKLERPVLNELGRKLVTPGGKRSETLDWLATKGGTLPAYTIDRFAQRFREVFKQVWGAWADKLLIAELAGDPAYQVEDLQRLIKNRVTTLVAQEVMTSSPEDLDTGRLNAVLSMVMASDKGRLEREKLLIAQGQAEHRAAKAEADVAKTRQDMALKQTRIDEALKALRSQIDDVAKRAAGGQQVPQSIFDTIRAELTRMGGDA